MLKTMILVINNIKTLGMYKTIILIIHKIKTLEFEKRRVSEIRNDILRKHLTKVLNDNDWYDAYKIIRKYNMSVIDRIDLASMLPIFEYGSINKGKEEWGIRWKNAPHNHRVLMVAPKDFAGSMYKLAESLNRYTDYAVRLITFDFHQFGYLLDLIVPECNGTRMEAVFKLASDSAIFHLKDEHSWFLQWERSLNLEVIDKLFFSNLFKNIPKVFTHYGGYARKFKHNKKYIAKVKKFDGRITMTPDLNFAWYDGKYIPHTIDTDKIQNCWNNSNMLVHSPSNPLTKATSLLNKAMNLLENNYGNIWREWKSDIIHGVSYEECMCRKQRGSLFFDQAGGHANGPLGINDVIGWYGNSAIEAMAYGIPTIAHLSDLACKRAEKAGCPIRDIPIINTSQTHTGLAEAILSFIMKSPKERRELSEKTRQFILDFHSYRNVSKLMAKVYDSLLARK